MIRVANHISGLIIAAGFAAAAMSYGGANGTFFSFAFCVILLVAIILGMPLYALLRSRGWANWWSAATSGFVIAAAIPTFMVLGSAPNFASTDGITTVVDRSYTTAGWLQAIKFVGLMGGIGAASAVIFWAIVRPRGLKPILTLPLAGVVVAAAVALPIITYDRSCHNTLQEGRTSIGPEALFSLTIDSGDWSKLDDILHTFARERDWSIRSDRRQDPSFPWFQASLCDETGTDIAVQNVGGALMIDVMQPQGGLSWREPFAALHHRISATWPGKTQFQGKSGEAISPPAWAIAPRADTQ